MKIVSSLALVVAVGWVSMSAIASQQIDTVPLNSTNYNAGRVAQATLTPLNSHETELSLFVSGVPNGTANPAHLYTYVYSGTCASHGSKPAYELNQVVSSEFNDQTGIQLSKSVPVAYDTLRSSGYALVVRGAPADGSHDLFCGNIGGSLSAL
ncbi:hypothetical protein [Buttiauxella gaviniae]|uniref:hypothetical protein n=1 Tax=Buttiauxella gaviniae TaxID=82990 RepID=UPI003BB6A26D